MSNILEDLLTWCILLYKGPNDDLTTYFLFYVCFCDINTFEIISNKFNFIQEIIMRNVYAKYLEQPPATVTDFGSMISVGRKTISYG